MKKFRNINTGLIEIVTNEELIKQYEKHNEVYEEIKENKKVNNKAEKSVENTDAE